MCCDSFLSELHLINGKTCIKEGVGWDGQDCRREVCRGKENLVRELLTFFVYFKKTDTVLIVCELCCTLERVLCENWL